MKYVAFVVQCVAYFLAVYCSIAGASDGNVKLTMMPVGDVQTRGKDESVLLTCMLSHPNYHLAWYKEHVPITDKQGRVYIESSNDNRRLKLFINNIKQEDAGKYRCEATGDDLPEPLHYNVELLIYEKMQFFYEEKQFLVVGTQGLIKCSVTGSPQPEISWKFNGAAISEDDRYAISSQGLTIKNVQDPDDSGEYTCHGEIISKGDTVEKIIDVEVHTQPTITKQLDSEPVNEGSEYLLKCTASGKPTPKYNFYRVLTNSDEEIIPDSRIKVDEVAGTLQFNPIEKDDDGTYKCVAKNDAGEDSSTGTVFVRVKPRMKEFSNVTVNENEIAVLTCEVNADPAAEISFTRVEPYAKFNKGDNELDDGRTVVVEGINERANVLTLKIDQVTSKDSGLYKCRAENVVDSVEATASLTVHYKPQFADDHKTHFHAWSGKKHNITCVSVGEPEPVIIWQHENEDEVSDSDVFTIFKMGNRGVLEVNPGDSEDVYQTYTCVARNTLGESKLSISLKEANVPEEPENIEIINTRPTSVLLKVVPPNNNGGVPVTDYQVEYNNSQLMKFSIDVPVLLENLEPATNYLFSVSAINEVGVGPSREISAATLAHSKPYPIQITGNKHGVHAHEYNVQWERPESGGKPIIRYKIEYRAIKADSSDADNWKFVEAISQWKEIEIEDNKDDAKTSYMLQGLLADMYYELRAQAENEIGWSSEIQETKGFIFHTAKMVHNAGSVQGNVATQLSSPSISSLVICFLLAACVSVFSM